MAYKSSITSFVQSVRLEQICWSAFRAAVASLDLPVCPLNKTQSLDFVINRLFMKLQGDPQKPGIVNDVTKVGHAQNIYYQRIVL